MVMTFADIDRKIAANLPGDTLKDIYPRLMRRLAEHGLLRGDGVVRTKHGFDMNVNRVDAIKWYLHYFGEFEPRISRAWKNFLRPGDGVVDIGGNIGYHALLASRCVGPQGRVVTFEPSSRIHRELCTNLLLNDVCNVRPIQAAVSNRAGTVELHYAGENDQGSSSIIRGTGKSEAVEAVTFAEIAALIPLADVDLIKIDVEGAEHLVIEAAEPFLDDLKDECAIFLEVGAEHDPQALVQPFLAKGFHIREIENRYRTSFYRSDGPVVLHPFRDGARELQDVVLCRSEAGFERLSG